MQRRATSMTPQRRDDAFGLTYSVHLSSIVGMSIQDSMWGLPGQNRFATRIATLRRPLCGIPLDRQRHKRACGDIDHLLVEGIQLGLDEGDAHLLPLLLDKLLSFVRKIVALDGGGLVGAHDAVVEIVHAAPKLVEIHEEVGLDGDEEMADFCGPGGVVGVGEMAGKGRAGEDAGEDVHHDGESGALGAADREQ